MRTLIINDTHFGVSRQGGTTKVSREALERWMLEQFTDLLNIPHDKLIVLGDLCDRREIPEHIMNELIHILADEKMSIVAGNHDLQGVQDHTMSSAEFIACVLNVDWVSEPVQFDDFYVIPHLHDQQEFDDAISEAPDGCFLLIHANIDSPFAHSDHSLNLSLLQIEVLKSKGVHIISGHEHAKRNMEGVTVIGNQFPSSIADCLSGDKRALILEDGKLSSVTTWNSEDFVNVHHDDVRLPDAKFIQVVGKCTPEGFPKILKKVAGWRHESEAFILKNNVEVIVENIVLGKEEVNEFNIVEMFLSLLPTGIRGKIVC